MKQIGQYHTLEILKDTGSGMFLDGGEEWGEILLPNKYVPFNATIGGSIKVFVYRDSEERIIATTEKPLAIVGEIAGLKVAEMNDYGAFLDWGVTKQLFVPFKEQKQRMMEGRSYVVYLYIDPKTDRIAATSKIEKYLSEEPPVYQNNEEVDLIIYQRTDLGYKAIINQSHIGLIFENEVFKRIYLGESMKGYIKQVREDGKIDLTLQKIGQPISDDLTDQILVKLKESSKGYLSINDKSDPEDISEMFGVSKKAFKKALGHLYKKRLITISDQGIFLTK